MGSNPGICRSFTILRLFPFLTFLRKMERLNAGHFRWRIYFDDGGDKRFKNEIQAGLPGAKQT